MCRKMCKETQTYDTRYDFLTTTKPLHSIVYILHLSFARIFRPLPHSQKYRKSVGWQLMWSHLSQSRQIRRRTNKNRNTQQNLRFQSPYTSVQTIHLMSQCRTLASVLDQRADQLQGALLNISSEKLKTSERLMHEALPVLDNIYFAYSGSLKCIFPSALLSPRSQKQKTGKNICSQISGKCAGSHMLPSSIDMSSQRNIWSLCDSQERGSHHPFHSESTAKYSLVDS